MNARMKTAIFIIVSVFIWIFYDIYIIVDAGKEASISQVLIDYFYDYPVGSFAFGLITGHLVWRMPDKECPNCGYKK